MESKNIVFPAPKQVSLISEQIPPLKPGQVLCKATKSLISIGTETNCLNGKCDKGTYWEDLIQYPFRPGYSMAGVVESVGEGVTTWKKGDRVCSWASHAQYFVQDASLLFSVPEHVSDEEAAWATLARTTQLGVRRANLEMGETAVVIGLGLLGQLVTQYIALSGAAQIIAIDTSASRLELARQSGATSTLHLSVADAVERVHELTNGEMADVVFDVTGHPAVLAPASALLRKLGRLVLLGDCPTPSQQVLGPRIVGNSVSILGIHGMMHPEVETPWNKWTAGRMTRLFFTYLKDHRLRVKHLITHRCDPADAQDIYTSLVKDAENVLGVILLWDRLTEKSL